MIKRNILLTIAGAIIMLLLAVNGYFVKNLIGSIDSLKDVANELRLMIEVHRESTKDHDNELKDHDQRLDVLELDFAVHKNIINAHCKDK